MKIAIISDIHGNETYLGLAKKKIEEYKIETVICCGDITSEAIFHELDSWKQEVYLVLGNADKELKRELESGLLYDEHLNYFSDFGVVNIEGRKIAFCHYDFLAKKLAKQQKYDLVFYGHTHTPWEEKEEKTILLNPGEIAAQFGKPTFAIYDLEKMKAQLVFL